ncbi:metallophosphoesterase [Beduini massiliensis]|uniref:metallophosphoesterase n=1 Tax=Beduini massiliensis TaxID=1585974 RepID=UPI00059A8CFD|nr:metallophosphoesterase [Beduini massiliensis]
MKIVKRLLKVFAVLFIVGCLCIGYAFLVEPKRLVVNEYELEKNDQLASIKIVQLSDTHVGNHYDIKQLDKLVEKTNRLDPDLIVFTGDLFDVYSQYPKNKEVQESLSRLQATYGKIAVWGNRDYGGGAERIYQDLMENAGFIVLSNEVMSIKVDNKILSIGGVDDFLLGNPQMKRTADQLNGDYNVLLMHEPDEAEMLVNTSADLILTGHSHGGQIRLPIIPGIRTELAHRYVDGFYTIDEDTLLFVNTGIGTTKIHARFMVPPEIDVFEIKF